MSLLDHLAEELADIERELRHVAHDLAAVQRQGSVEALLRLQRRLGARRQTLIDLIDRAWLPIDGLCLRITDLAREGLDHDAEERELLRLLGTHSVDARVWAYVAAALRAREEPNEVHFVAWLMARAELQGELRRAA